MHYIFITFIIFNNFSNYKILVYEFSNYLSHISIGLSATNIYMQINSPSKELLRIYESLGNISTFTIKCNKFRKLYNINNIYVYCSSRILMKSLDMTKVLINQKKRVWHLQHLEEDVNAVSTIYNSNETIEESKEQLNIVNMEEKEKKSEGEKSILAGISLFDLF